MKARKKKKERKKNQKKIKKNQKKIKKNQKKKKYLVASFYAKKFINFKFNGKPVGIPPEKERKRKKRKKEKKRNLRKSVPHHSTPLNTKDPHTNTTKTHHFTVDTHTQTEIALKHDGHSDEHIV